MSLLSVLSVYQSESVSSVNAVILVNGDRALRHAAALWNALCWPVSHAAQPSTNLTSGLSVSHTSPVHEPSKSNCPQTHKPMKSSVNWAWRQPAAVGQFHSCSSYLLLALIISWHAPAIPHPHPTPATAHCASARPPARLTQWLCSSTQTHINTSAHVSIRHQPWDDVISRQTVTCSAHSFSATQPVNDDLTPTDTCPLNRTHRTANSLHLHSSQSHLLPYGFMCISTRVSANRMNHTRVYMLSQAKSHLHDTALCSVHRPYKQ